MSTIIAYYCSGHGYGHATRVSALASHLLLLPDTDKPIIHIISSAPKHVFADSVALGALYRYAEIDPVIVQPVAYRVDRQKSVEVLKSFLARKDALLDVETQWLQRHNVRAVMSDAAFLGCLAAKAAGIPSILITNFTFDSVYSYLSTNLIDASSPHPMHLDPNNMHLEPHPRFDGIVPDVPVPFAELSPLVDQIHEGYRCADLLLTLPGNIPIPSFSQTPALPAPNWVDSRVNKFHPEIIEHLIHPPSAFVNLPPIPFPSWSPLSTKIITRTTSSAPLLVRPPTVTPSSVYTPEGRSRVLSSVGVPIDLHDPTHTKVLLVSFGGQTIRKPSRSRSGSTLNSKAPTRVPTPEGAESHQAQIVVSPPPSVPADMQANGVFGDCLSNASPITRKSALIDMHLENLTLTKQLSEIDLLVPHLPTSPKLATPSHIWIPGAPPALKAPNTPSPTMVIPTVATFPPTPVTSPTPRRPVISSDRAYFDIVRADPANFEDGDFSHLLPDSSWIAIVCGVSKEQWNEEGDDSELPEGFYVAPKTVYMPDLTAVSNVLLGKLGYGTVAECVDACTPFVYVSRPMFIEEHGLRLLLDREGVGIELSRESYEAGDWASTVEEAYARGKEAKERKRKEGLLGIGIEKKEREGRDLAELVMKWIADFWDTSR